MRVVLVIGAPAAVVGSPGCCPPQPVNKGSETAEMMVAAAVALAMRAVGNSTSPTVTFVARRETTTVCRTHAAVGGDGG